MKRRFIRFIKRICFRTSKRLIRFLIYFNVLVCFLTISVFGASSEYSMSFPEFSDNGNLFVYRGYGTVGDNLLGWDDYIGEVPTTVNFTGTDSLGSQYFDSVRLQLESPIIHRSMSAGDVFILNEVFSIDVNITGSNLNTVKTIRDSMTFKINYRYTDGSGKLGFVNFVGADYYDISLVQTFEWGKRINFNLSIPGWYTQADIEIVSLEYGIYDISKGITVYGANFSFTAWGSSDAETIKTFYTGSPDNAPFYSSVDSSDVDDYHELEDDVLNDAFEQNPLEKFSGFFGHVQSYFNLLDITKCFTVWSFWFGDMIGYKWFGAIVFFSITLGLFGFVFSIARDGVNSSNRSSRSYKKTSINNQRQNNFKGD